MSLSPSRKLSISVVNMLFVFVVVLYDKRAVCFQVSDPWSTTRLVPDDPEFGLPIGNLTTPVGREAVLSCTVDHLGKYKVGWLKAEDQTILTLHNKVVTHNSRISVTHDNHRTWQLHIRQVKESDRGCYMCQINTNVMKKQVGCVDVH
ncbi:lachesin-like, partial [Zootermopsis nevadensis]|uniref:lachesin-like n=1 Tax=Zootermopsis nevadensis TaxID=136037 RepID=UPI000B8E2352